jgi:hypothetical protein
VLKFSKQGYYRWRASPVTERDGADAHLVNAALDIHADDPAFGYRFIADVLPEKGLAAGENSCGGEGGACRGGGPACSAASGRLQKSTPGGD